MHGAQELCRTYPTGYLLTRMRNINIYSTRRSSTVSPVYLGRGTDAVYTGSSVVLIDVASISASSLHLTYAKKRHIIVRQTHSVRFGKGVERRGSVLLQFRILNDFGDRVNIIISSSSSRSCSVGGDGNSPVFSVGIGFIYVLLLVVVLVSVSMCWWLYLLMLCLSMFLLVFFLCRRVDAASVYSADCRSFLA